MMLMIKEGVYLISRDLSISKIQLRFPCKKQMNRTLCETLLDGILVEDRDKDEIFPRYLAFDIVTLEVIIFSFIIFLSITCVEMSGTFFS